MARTTPVSNSTWGLLLRWAGGPAYLGAGVVLGLSILGLVWQWVDGQMAYRVPHACACLECLHETAEAPDGRVHCAKFPPADLALSGAAGDRYRRTRVMAGICAVLTLVFAGTTSIQGMRWLTGSRSNRRGSRWRPGVRTAAPALALAAAILTRMLLWPVGLFSF